MGEYILALSALRYRNIDLMAAFGGERLGEQRPLFEIMRDQHATRARLIVVELRHERAQHLAGRQGAVRLGKIRAVAPVLTGAKEEHLDAGEPALLIKREHVGFFQATRIDA